MVPNGATSGDLRDGAVEPLIQREDGARVAISRLVLPRDGEAQLGGVRFARAGGGEAHDVGLHRFANESGPLHLRHPDLAHEGAALRADFEKVLVGEPDERLPHGLAGQPVGRRNLLLRQPHARRELAAHDPRAQALEELTADRVGHPQSIWSVLAGHAHRCVPLLSGDATRLLPYLSTQAVFG